MESGGKYHIRFWVGMITKDVFNHLFLTPLHTKTIKHTVAKGEITADEQFSICHIEHTVAKAEILQTSNSLFATLLSTHFNSYVQ